MADEPRFASDEYVITRYDHRARVEAPGDMVQQEDADDLTLTNKRVIIHHEKTKLFGSSIHSYDEIPLLLVKNIDGNVQACVEESRGGRQSLALYLTDGRTVRIVFAYDKFNKKIPTSWASEIIRALLGGPSPSNDTSLRETTNSASAIPYAEDVAKAVSGTVDVFRSAFRRSRRETAPERVIYCQGCGAKTTIRQGETKYCQYCGSPITVPLN